MVPVTYNRQEYARVTEVNLRAAAIYLQRGPEDLCCSAVQEASRMGIPLPNLKYAQATAFAQLGKLGSAKFACMQELKVQPGHKGTLELLARLDTALKAVESGAVRNTESPSFVP